MKTIELGAERRDLGTKGRLREMRAAGRIPAVVYGGEGTAESLSIQAKQLQQVLRGHGTNVIMDLDVSGKRSRVLLKDLQRDFVTHNIVHVDFQRISMTEKLEVNVPLQVTGEAPGVKLGGGILEHILRELRVRSLPDDIPDAIQVDVSNLQINQGIKVKDLALPSGLEVLADLNHLVVNVVAPSELEEPAATPAAGAPASAEPEVIAKGKKPEEGEAAAAATPAGAVPGAKPGAAPAAKAGAAPAAKEKK